MGSKEKVLLAMYEEYQKDLPDMSKITHEKLNMERDIFFVAVEKLQNEQLIEDAYIGKIDQSEIPVKVSLNGATISSEGMVYIKQLLS